MLAHDGKIQLVISEWVINEIIAAIEKKTQKDKIDNHDAHDILFAMTNFLEDRYRDKSIVSFAINEKVVLNSRTVIESLHVNAADSLHVLIAGSAGCSYFVSADKELNSAIRKSRLNMTPVDILYLNQVDKFADDIELPYR